MTREAELEAEVERLRRRVAELEAARNSEEGERMRALLVAVMDAFPGTVHVKDRDDRYEFVNRFFLESWGVTREDCLGRRPADVFPAYGPVVAARDRQVIETGRALPFYEVEYPDRGGRRAVVLSTKLPLFDEAGGVERIITVGLDITGLKAAESAHRRSEALMRAVVQSSADAIAIADQEGRFLEFNPAAEALFGIPRGAVLGASEAGAPAPSFLARLAEAMRSPSPGIVERREVEFVRATGDVFPAELTVAAAPLDSGLVAIATVRDLTERRRAERLLAEQQQALHQSEKMGALGSLLAGVAHELNNPLSVVLAQAALMQETVTDPAMLARADRIHGAAERCARIVRSFLAIARQRPPEYAAIRLADVVRASLDITGYGLKSSGVEVAVEIPEGLPPVWGDADQLGQVFMNLVVNAQQALQELEGPRRLAFRAGLDEAGWIRIVVEDNGPGVSQAIRSRIFDPFFTSKPMGSGTGVGLSVCLGIVASHGGTIRLQDTPGGGATFVLCLPRAPAEGEKAEAVPEDEVPAARGKAILIVDDEPEIAHMLAEILQPMASRIDIAENGIAALERVGRHRYDLVISDLRMPVLDGPGLFRRLKERDEGLDARVLFVTGDTLHRNLELFLETTGAPVLEKPFHPREVRRKVGEMLERLG